MERRIAQAAALGVTGCKAMGTAARSKPIQGAALGGALGAGVVLRHQNHHAG